MNKQKKFKKHEGRNQDGKVKRQDIMTEKWKSENSGLARG
jgi:hypothetical protein